MPQAEPSLRESLNVLAKTLPSERPISELQGVLASLGVARDLGKVPAVEVPAEFARAVTARVDEILNSGGPSIQEMRSLRELVDRYVANLPSPTAKPWGAALMRLYQANRDVAILDSGSLAMTPDGELAGWVELSDGRYVCFKGGTLIKQIGGKEVKDCVDIRTTPDGELVGQVRLSDGRYVPFRGETLIEQIGGKEVKKLETSRRTPPRVCRGITRFALEG